MKVGEKYLMLIHDEWTIITYELHWNTHAENLKWRYGSPTEIYLLNDVVKLVRNKAVPAPSVIQMGEQ